MGVLDKLLRKNSCFILSGPWQLVYAYSIGGRCSWQRVRCASPPPPNLLVMKGEPSSFTLNFNSAYYRTRRALVNKYHYEVG
jgi:hypothetical protein